MNSNHIADVGVLEFSTDAELAAVELFKEYPKPLLQFAVTCCVIFILIGIPGNLITIIALGSYKKFRNATAFFIISLHLNNLIFCCMILPMTVSNILANHWVFGMTMCRVYALMKYSLNGNGIFIVVTITVNRYIMVCHPHAYARFYKRRILMLLLIITWVFGFAMFLPSFFGVWGQFNLDPEGGNCSMVKVKNKYCPKTLFICIGFVAPYLIISICYGRIWWVVRQATKKCNSRNAIQPTMSNSIAETSIAEIGNGMENIRVCMDPNANENGTDDRISCIATSPNGRDSTVVDFFKTTFKSVRNKSNSRLPTRKDQKLATMILAIIISFIVCHLPLMMTRLIYGNYKSDPNLNILAHLLEYSTSVISPIIYVIMSNEYRLAYTSLFDNVKHKIIKCFAF